MLFRSSSNAYRDIKNGMDTAKEEGRKEGREEGIRDATLNHAKAMKMAGIAQDLIAKITGLSEEDVERL